MKYTTDGAVPDRAYYYLLDWRDSNMEEFYNLTEKLAVKYLSTLEF